MKEITVYDTINHIINVEDDPAILKDKLLEFHPFDIAKVFEDIEKENREKIYKAFSDRELSYLFSYLDLDDTVIFLNELEPKRIASVLEEMEVDDAADIIKEMDNSEQVQEYLRFLSKETREEISSLSSYDEDVVGSIMTTNYIEVKSDIDVKEAMKTLISEADETEVIDPIYISDNKKLVGILHLKDLIIARSPKIIKEIMETNFISVNVNEDTIDAVQKMRNYGIKTLPVLDNQELVGIITIDDAIDVIEEDANYQYSNLAGVVSDIDEEASIFRLLLKRIPWLLILLVLSLLVSNIISAFEGIIRQVTVLIFFQTLILGMAGNLGTQSLAVTIRGISRSDLDSTSKVRKHLFKELKIILINSLACAAFAFIVSYIFLYIKALDGINISTVALIVSLSMFLTLITSGHMGVLLPLLFNRLNIDPAVASGPFITTLNDIVSILIYFNLAALLLNL